VLKKSYLVTGMLLLCYQPLFAEPEISVKTQHYAVYGSTAKEIRSYMSERSPAMAEGRKYDGYTSWRVRWNYNFDQEEGYCYLAKIKTEVKVTIMMPELRLKQTLPYQLQQDWNTYYDALTKHENGHRDYGIKATKEIDAALNEMDGESSCELLKQKANANARSILNKYKVLEKAYDRDTEHGLTQGAYFPR
jgi:predicted secreted Zn-dependent protease